MARIKNRFNAVAVPETASIGATVKKTKTFRVALYARLSVELKAKPSESIANQLDIMRKFIKEKRNLQTAMSMRTVQFREPALTDRFLTGCWMMSGAGR